MADFELTIDELGFQRTGIAPLFDESLYGELLEEFAPRGFKPFVYLRPNSGWGRSLLGKTRQLLLQRGEYSDHGEYDEGRLDIICVQDLEETNDTLLHETKHYIDDVSGEMRLGEATQRKRAIIVGATTFAVAASTAVGIELSTALNPALAGFTMLPSIPINRHWVHMQAPHEVAAREFADNPVILEAFGCIIKYRQQ